MQRRASRMIRRSLIVACILSALISAHGSAAGSNSIRIGGWSGGPSTQGPSKRFEACSARAANPQGIVISYSVDSQYRWRLTFSDPAWSFTDGYSLNLILRLGDRNYLRGRAVVTGTQTLEIRTDDDLALFSGLWASNRLQVTAGGLKFEFELISSNEVLAALMQCALRQSSSPGRKNAIPLSIRTDSDTRAETRSIASEILAYSRIGDVQMSAGSPTPSAGQGVTSWRSGLISSTLDVLEPKGIARLTDVPFRLLDQESRKCRNGFFFTWGSGGVDRLEIVRMFTACPAPEVTTFAYHFALSRSKGGYYLLSSTISGGGFGGVVQQLLEEMDLKLRGSFTLALKKFEQAQAGSRSESDVTTDKPEAPAPLSRD